MTKTIIRDVDDLTGEKRRNAIAYWCNACGELHYHGKHDITENELPAPLRWAYNNLWEEGAGGCLTYLVDTADECGRYYGIALIAEYDEYIASEHGLSMPELFDSLLVDLEAMAGRDEFQFAHLIALEYSGFDECHELIVVLPAYISKEEFDAVAKAVYELAYKDAGKKG